MSRGIVGTIALWVLASSCAGPRESSRAAYADVDEGPYVPLQTTQAETMFEVLEEWSWTPGLADDDDDARPAAIQSTLAAPLGLFPGRDFRLVTGRCEDCRVPDAALWYFRDELIAVPRLGVPTAGLDSSKASLSLGLPELPRPLLVWVGSPHLVDDALLSADSRWLHAGPEHIPLVLGPKNEVNRYYASSETALFFQQRPLRVRGEWARAEGREVFVARSLWPKDAAIVPSELTLKPLQRHEPLSTLVEAQEGGVRGVFSTRLLWEREPGARRDWAGQPVMALVLNGSQSDDDGGQGGHVAMATGTFRADGDWSDWLVNNFYPLDTITEERVLSSAVPMDSYLFDLNSGQAYLHPSTMWVAVLRRPEAAHLFQWALQETHHHYYCHELEFDRSTMNSTRMSIEPLRLAGWRIPRIGATSWLLAVLSLPVSAGVALFTEFGAEPWAGLTVERTNMMPRAAFQVAGHDLLHLLTTDDESVLADLTPTERRLLDDVEAVLFVRIPQAPTDRSIGTYPAASLFEYAVRWLEDPTPWEQPPLPDAPPFPDELKETCP